MHRIKTEVGVDKQININLEQDFDFLEILSLKISQQEIYNRNCADYGVVVGRITANNGYGLSNVKVSIFVPITEADKENPIITSIYPYTNTQDTNEDGYRYNLLPYEPSYSTHAATGTFPSRDDVLNNEVVSEIYDKYYKYTVKTNSSGDYMIFGVPIGAQTVFVDIDLSDIGEFSLTPQDLIRMGLATESQLSGNRFRSSTNLNELPQIVSLQKNIEVSPLWGQEEVCDISINRVDFDLRADANIDIQPSAAFMGSIISTSDNFRIRSNCKPRDDFGNLCSLETNVGQILAIRQTIFEDTDGNPILEEYQLENSGNVIDGDGTWLIEVPMNLDYVTTNELGEKIITNDPKRGIPTKGKYRFKIKWQQSKSLTQQNRRAYFLVPNIREPWTFSSIDPNYENEDSTSFQTLSKAYYFGLDWSGYTNTETAIACEDTFYEFEKNKVYTVSSLLDNYKNGSSRGNFIGIKEINDNTCTSVVNKFPTNDGVRNFDLIYFIFSILFQVLQLLGLPLLFTYHILAFLWNNFAVPLLIILIGLLTFVSGSFFAIAIFSALSPWLIAGFIALGIAFLTASIALTSNFRRITQKKFGRIKLPMITYPNCQSCECEQENIVDGNGDYPNSLLSPLANSAFYYEGIRNNYELYPESDDNDIVSSMIAEIIGTRTDDKKSVAFYKSTESKEYRLPSNAKKIFGYSTDLPLAERINVFNTRKKYFDNQNKIRVTFNKQANLGKFHYDNTLTLLLQDNLEPGTLISFVNPQLSNDLNYKFTGATTNSVSGIPGNSLNNGNVTISVKYANTQKTESVVTYLINNTLTNNNYKFPSDVEYYQVVTAITVSEAAKIWNANGSLPKALTDPMRVFINEKGLISWGQSKEFIISPSLAFDSFDNQYITILQRGVDPYSPLITNEYGLGHIFGYTDPNEIVVSANTRMNIPIQIVSGNLSTQQFTNQDNIFYPSYFFQPGNSFSAFTTNTVGYYGAIDGANRLGNKLDKLTIDNLEYAVSKLNNPFASNSISDVSYKYDRTEDLSGAGYYYGEVTRNNNNPRNTTIEYYSPSLYDRLSNFPMNINNKNKNVLRTDRLPSSDYLDGVSWEDSASLLQQNLGLSTYIINVTSEVVEIDSVGNNDSTYNPDIEGQLASEKVFNSFECSNMVGLTCYQGSGNNFSIKDDCENSDAVENGCYVFMKRPLLDLGKDLRNFSEWGYRFRFFYGICRGVLSQTFNNNWVNGVLFAFPFQANVTFDSNNEPNAPSFCKDLIFYDSKTNNFYYRSSPYQNNKFIGKITRNLNNANNDRNLLFPVTIVDLGLKNQFYRELTFDKSANYFVVDKLNPTSYSDTSDLVNLFVISRILDERFLRRILSFLSRNNSLAQLFSRENSRVDGDLAQLLSINSEEGVIKFSPEFYNSSTNSVVLASGKQNNIVGVFYSSTTEDLQFKDFISPGRLNIRTDAGNLIQLFYGNKSQPIPVYQWQLAQDSTNIFGNEYNDWSTGPNDIKTIKYQNFDRLTLNQYFTTSNAGNNDTFLRGYIFNVDANGNYSSTAGRYPNKFVVGAPHHFYFGLFKGKTAIDKFKSKYLSDE